MLAAVSVLAITCSIDALLGLFPAAQAADAETSEGATHAGPAFARRGAGALRNWWAATLYWLCWRTL